MSTSFGHLEEGYENLMAYDTWYMDDSMFFPGVPGVEYYALVIFYVVKGTGSDSRVYFTNTVKA